jgi:hypothetical protein
MNDSSMISQKRAPFWSRRLTRKVVPLAIALGMTLQATSASATGIPVVDAAHTIQNVFTQLWVEGKNAIKWGQDYAEQLAQTRQLLQDYQAKISGAANFMDRAMLMDAQFQERSPDDISKLAQIRCGAGASTQAMSDLWKRFVPDMSGDIKKQQLKICAQIVLMESERYNEQVKMLKRVRESSEELERLDKVRSSYGNDATLGDMTGSNNDISRFAARGSMDMDYFRTAMITYDGFIASLRSDQKDLALQAMRGKQTPWGSVIQGATLKAALDVQR